MRRSFPLGYAATATASLSLVTGGAALALTNAPVVGTGVGSTPGGRDVHWNIVAGPTSFNPSPDSYPYQAYTQQSAPFYAPGGGLPQTGVTVDSTTFYWIGPAAISSDNPGLGPGNWIFKQTFTVAADDTYRFDIQAGADNQLTLYLGGALADTGTDYPTITGGTLIGSAFNTFRGTLGPILADIPLTANTYTLYAVLQNSSVGPGGFLLAPATNAPATNAPAPLPIFGAAAAFGASLRLKRRIRLARLTVSGKAG